MRHKKPTALNPAKKRWSELVLEVRDDKEETQAQFACRFSVAGQTVQQWESQGNLPGPESRQVMAKILGWTTDELNHYLKTGETADVEDFNSARTIAQLQKQETKVIADFIHEVAKLLYLRVK